MGYARAEKKEIHKSIFDDNAFPFGEYLVIARDVLMRFMKTEVGELPPDIEKSFEKILDDALKFYQRTGGREDISLNIPMGHRYTKFIYVVDPLAMYMPYHYHIPELYGIYFREKKILSDLKDFLGLAWELMKNERFYERLRISEVDKSDIKALMRHPGISLSILIALYVEALYTHALAHHVLEDISTLFELRGGDKYSIIRDSREEEAFCEYVMYVSLRGELGWNEPGGGFALKLIYRLRDMMIIPPVSPDDLTRFLRAYRKIFAPMLYIHRSKGIYTTYRFFKPNISEEVSEKLLLAFRSFWISHIYECEPVEIGVEGKDIFARIYVTDL